MNNTRRASLFCREISFRASRATAVRKRLSGRILLYFTAAVLVQAVWMPVARGGDGVSGEAAAASPRAATTVEFRPFECGGMDVFEEPGSTLARMVMEHVQRNENVALYHVDELQKLGRDVERSAPDYVVSGSLTADYGGYGGWMASITRIDVATG